VLPVRTSPSVANNQLTYHDIDGRMAIPFGPILDYMKNGRKKDVGDAGRKAEDVIVERFSSAPRSALSGSFRR
jgi:hypothetical protein